MSGPRFPLFCTRCGSREHYAEDCKRMPTHMGLSQLERDMIRQERQERTVFILAGLSIVLSLVLFGLLERVPT